MLDEFKNEQPVVYKTLINSVKNNRCSHAYLIESNGYSKALDLLDDYDHKTLKKIDGNIDERQIEYNESIQIINKLRFNEESTLFAVERDKGLESIIGNIYQSFARTRYL